MKFVLACYGTRGDVEPCAAVGRELLHRGHEVRMAVSPDLVGFAESAGLAAVAYGPGLAGRTWTRTATSRRSCSATSGGFRDLIRLLREFRELGASTGGKVSTTLTSLADGADLLLTGPGFRGRRRQRRRVLRHSVGHAGLPSAAGQRPAPSLPAGAVGPLRNDGVRVAGLARGEEGRGRAAPRTGPAEGNRPRAATDRRTRIAGNPGLRRGLLPRAGSRMGEMEWPAALCWRADDWSCRPMPMRRSRRGLPREHRRFSSGLAACRSNLRPTRSP